jgi:hypothetical protein
MEGESTQPVEITSNPFADEPTETAFTTPPGMPPRMVSTVTPNTLRQTQPMRTVGDDDPATAITIPPPPKKPPEKEAKSQWDGPTDQSGKKVDDDDAKTETVATVADGAGGAEKNEKDAAPAEIATADTGQVSMPKDKGAS